jgi:hypothetical protein
MSILFNKPLITSFFIMPRGCPYTVRVRRHRRRPPGSYRRRYGSARYPGGHVLSRADLVPYLTLLDQNGLLPQSIPPPVPPTCVLTTAKVAIPALSSKTFTRSGTTSLAFDLPPAPEGVIESIFHLLCFETLTYYYPQATQGYVNAGFIDSSDDALTAMILSPLDSSSSSTHSGRLFVWFYDDQLYCGVDTPSAVTASVFSPYVGKAAPYSAMAKFSAVWTPANNMNNATVTIGDVYVEYIRIVEDD